MVGESDKAAAQAAEYVFPYHHVPSSQFGHLRTARTFRGGAEYRAYLDEVIAAIVEADPRDVLDAGCGDGRLLADARHQFPAGREPRMTGIDIDGRAVAFANAFGAEIEFREADVATLSDEFDVVTCVETLEHVPDDREVSFLGNVATRVRRGGTLLITVPSTARAVHPKHFRHYTSDSLRAAVETAAPDLVERRVYEIVQHRPWLDALLRVLNNRVYSVDIGVLNDAILRLHRRSVRPGARGLHVFAVYDRPAV